MSEEPKSWQFIATPGQTNQPDPSQPPPRTWEQELDASNAKNWSWKPYNTRHSQSDSLFEWDDPPSTHVSTTHGDDDAIPSTDPLLEDLAFSTHSPPPMTPLQGESLLSSLQAGDVEHLYAALLRPDEDTEQFLESVTASDSDGDLDVPATRSDSQMQVTMMRERTSDPTLFCDVHSSDNPPTPRASSYLEDEWWSDKHVHAPPHATSRDPNRPDG